MGPEPEETVLHEGYLLKAPPLRSLKSNTIKKWHRRWVVLDRQTRTLSYYSDQTQSKLKGVVDLQSVMNVETNLANKKFSNLFSLQTPGRDYYFGAESGDAMERWATRVRSLCDPKKVPIPSIPRGRSDASGMSIVSRSTNASRVSVTSPGAGYDAGLTSSVSPSYAPSLPTPLPNSPITANPTYEDLDSGAGSSPSLSASGGGAGRTHDLTRTASNRYEKLSSTPPGSYTVLADGSRVKVLYKALHMGKQVWLRLANSNIELLDFESQTMLDYWPLHHLRCFGQDHNKFKFEAGRKCPSGEGKYSFDLDMGEDMFGALDKIVAVANMAPSALAAATSTYNTARHSPQLQKTVMANGHAYNTPDEAKTAPLNYEQLDFSSNNTNNTNNNGSGSTLPLDAGYEDIAEGASYEMIQRSKSANDGYSTAQDSTTVALTYVMVDVNAPVPSPTVVSSSNYSPVPQHKQTAQAMTTTTSYAMVDIGKTAALGKAMHAQQQSSEPCRATRHDFSLAPSHSDFPPAKDMRRQSSSMSVFSNISVESGESQMTRSGSRVVAPTSSKEDIDDLLNSVEEELSLARSSGSGSGVPQTVAEECEESEEPMPFATPMPGVVELEKVPWQPTNEVRPYRNVVLKGPAVIASKFDGHTEGSSTTDMSSHLSHTNGTHEAVTLRSQQQQYMNVSRSSDTEIKI